ncbi:Aste57867_12710 [Aphanomyces stellatus]|uniref:Aste57867_12710 protein n=1 Tax=Aphanomyces stellatus TaxID=120398 RepID=A0A485KWY1_9STRA|nr:hypothetical protein As57867_012662 [Aphanomyces stellatus]VFT89560.1 Aste57867_12710 [Aphanomyces stellatus]
MIRRRTFTEPRDRSWRLHRATPNDEDDDDGRESSSSSNNDDDDDRGAALGCDPIDVSSYRDEHIPKTTALGEVLMTFASTTISTPRVRSSPPPVRSVVWTWIGRSPPWYVHMIVATCVLLAWWFAMLSLHAALSTRVVQCGTIVGLLGCSALVYLSCAWVLMRIPVTADLGYKLWWRLLTANPDKDDDAAVRSFLESCTWVAVVLGTYAAYQSPSLAVVVGGISGMWVVAVGDFLMVYIRVHSDFLEDDEQPLSLKYTVTTVCLGYILLGLLRLGYAFVSNGDDMDHPSMALEYLLTILVGVSLIVTSELLMLYGPTRHAGIVLQSRVVNAKANWMSHPLRSLLELCFVFGVTIALHDIYDNVVYALQLGTLLTTVAILCGDYLLYPTTTTTSTTARPADLSLPQDHWIKVLPLVCLGALMLYTVGRILHLHILLLLPVANVVVLAILAKLFRMHVLWHRLAALPHHVATHPCRSALELLLHVGFHSLLRPQLPAWAHVTACVVFDAGLVTAQTLGPRLWDAIFAVRYASTWTVQLQLQPSQRRTFSDLALAQPPIWSIDNANVLPPGPHTPPSTPTSDVPRYELPLCVLVNFAIVALCPMAGMRYGCLLLLRIAGTGPSLVLALFLSLCAGTWVGLVTSSSHAKFRFLRRLVVCSLQQQCVLHPLQVFVQVAICLGVLIGSYVLSGVWVYSFVLAGCSVVGVVAGGHYVVRRFSSPTNDHLHATCAMVFFLALLTYALVLCLWCIYFHIDRLEVAFCLATLSGVVFVASSELFIMWEPTRVAGYILQTRVTHCVHNWQIEPLRSFLEVFVWISVTYGTFALYQDVLVALHLGTFSGIVVTLAGEVFRNRWRFHQPVNVNQRPKVLPLLLFFAYVGAGTFQWIFEHLRSLEVTVVLATVAGIVFLCVADVLAMWQPTRWAGVILQDRFLNAGEHWQRYPVRSFVEVGCFLGVIYGSHAIYGDLSVAVQCGTLSGMLVTLIGERLKSHNQIRYGNKHPQSQILPFPIISVLGFVGCVAFNSIYTHLRSIEMAFVLATTSGVAFILLGDVFVFWPPTRYVGLILQDRILQYTRLSFWHYSWRCWWELLLCTVALYVSYGYLWRGDLLVAIQVCTFTGILACVVDERIWESIQQYEQTLGQQGCWHAQDQSALLSMPYEVLFETARFMTPEELLVTRTTCHKINNLLRAESKRFWLHAALRRQFGLSHQRGTPNPYRSLIYEAYKAVMPKIFGPREPASVLTAQIARNRALKWVFINADWIRRQNMPRRNSGDRFIELEPSDCGFEVFRHMPDKDLLGIHVQHNQMLETTKLTVPSRVYGKIQADPFSFVVSETLYEVEEFSSWHLCNVLFVAMAVVCLGQAAAEFAFGHM